MKFAIAFVIGDTPLHDQLCCRMGSWVLNVAKMCRHCKVDSQNVIDPRNFSHIDRLWHLDDFVIDTHVNKHEDEARFRRMSHHRMHNVFHQHQFGENPNNIHFATPGELLHMHQLGVAKRSIESISQLVGPSNNEFETIARKLGGALSQNSDRRFPRSRFGTNNNVLNPNMKEGKDYAGMLLCLLLALLTPKGRAASKLTANKICDQVGFIEFLLGMEEFLKHGVMTLSRIDKL